MVLGRQNFSGDRRARLHHQPSDLAFELGQHLGVLAHGGLVRPGDDLLGRGRRLPRFLRLQPCRRRPCVLDELPALGICPGQHLPALDLDRGQLRLDLLGVRQPPGDLLPPRRQHLEDRLVGEQVQHPADDGEADDLSEEVRPVDAEGARYFTHGSLLGSGYWTLLNVMMNVY